MSTLFIKNKSKINLRDPFGSKSYTDSYADSYVKTHVKMAPNQVDCTTRFHLDLIGSFEFKIKKHFSKILPYAAAE
jgi:hypothetical protein